MDSDSGGDRGDDRGDGDTVVYDIDCPSLITGLAVLMLVNDARMVAIVVSMSSPWPNVGCGSLGGVHSPGSAGAEVLDGRTPGEGVAADEGALCCSAREKISWRRTCGCIFIWDNENSRGLIT